METFFLIVVVAGVAAMVLVTLVVRRRNPDWFGLTRADRQMIVRAVRRGEAVPDGRLAAQARRRAELIVAQRDSRHWRFLPWFIALLTIVYAVEAAFTHDRIDVFVTAGFTVSLLVLLYDRLRDSRAAAEQAIVRNSGGPVMD